MKGTEKQIAYAAAEKERIARMEVLKMKMQGDAPDSF